MMMCFNRIISTAAKCSLVCGCGHVSFPATKSNAPSITAAPFNIVAIRISCPGQSTKETCLISFIFLSSKSFTKQSGSSGFELEYAQYLSGLGHFGSSHSYIFAFAYPSLIVMFLSNSFLKRTVCTPEIAFTTVDFPCATCPIVPMLIVACLEMISGDKGFSEEMSSLVKSCTDNPSSPFTYTILFSSFVLVGSVVFPLSLSLC
mmetsp:Transcript_6702/g.20871  ORF Transcript_6702/g.20871 Transcript_6702/m.20871 type:complete len:204 (-) Transcript_6702:383-994(-)